VIITARKYNFADHYEMLVRWWNAHPTWTPVPAPCLPKGFVIRSEERFICAGFLYKTVGTPVNAIEWVISNPDTTKRERDKGLDLLFTSLLSLTSKGELILGFSHHPSLIRKYEKFGFQESDKGMSLMIKANKE